MFSVFTHSRRRKEEEERIIQEAGWTDTSSSWVYRYPQVTVGHPASKVYT